MNVAFAIEKVYTACPVGIVILSALISFGIICVAHKTTPHIHVSWKTKKMSFFAVWHFLKKPAITDEDIFKKIRKVSNDNGFSCSKVK
ncbi:hypothetical protein [Candidatus Endomicrobiellum trichonymphae]|uniref:hypothetical protein n=1 Tax=Endomicrobium trichonymphae TaxID=1408204 RepID=UPI0039B86CA2